MNEPLGRYNVTVTVGCDANFPPDPARVRGGGRPGGMEQVCEHHQRAPGGQIISIVTVTAPDRYAAVAVARAVVSDALKRQSLSLQGAAAAVVR
jgi:hypothetical protein